ncbi:flagellar hook-associated protein FlgL [Metabacillus arenae]|uniref:Flagellar hook-associated protein FlgL n=1 Tax=Metabacillus arenae TaxID=2771434 RepID=A0A926RXW4_9BACI|nr:flagellar hook-associated protein FlgL [Metabacillus arenae]MBD1381391.1 flagellar hook-associated protein FlgL [Metabacillus arenae]
MRVTQGMLANNAMRNLSRSYQMLGKYQDQMNTGKKIQRPSDDPVVAMKGMFYRTNLTEIEQYKRNLTESYQWMENSEGGIEHAQQVVHRVRELLVQAKNGTNSPEDLKSIEVEINQLKEDLIGVANTQVAGRYIFNGTKTDQPAISKNSDGSYTYHFESSDFMVEVSKGVQLKSNVDGLNAFGEKLESGDNLFETLEKIQAALNSGNMSGSEDFLNDINAHFDTMNAERSELGARYNRLELIEDRLSNQEITANKTLSENEDADIEKVIMNLTIQESLHRASLAVGSRLIQPTLMDFLR